MQAQEVIAQMQHLVGKELFLSDWKEITQEQIYQFADCTGDHQWIHVDVEKAKQGPFGEAPSLMGSLPSPTSPTLATRCL